VVAALLVATAATAQGYPGQEIRLVVGFPAGGITDAAARIAANSLSKSLGRPVLVENNPGEGGRLAATRVEKAAGDGHTLLVAREGLPPSSGLVPVALLATSPVIVAVRQHDGVSNFSHLVAKAKESGVKYIAIPGSAGHSAAEVCRSATQSGMSLVSSREAIVKSLLSKEADAIFDHYYALSDYMRDGSVRAVAVAGSQRLPALPDVPTTAEAGYHECSKSAWIGIACSRRHARPSS
jgi:tripartite-type tricarboxylate transporter receptor subunit TctC